jgi:hypothetical protein
VLIPFSELNQDKILSPLSIVLLGEYFLAPTPTTAEKRQLNTVMTKSSRYFDIGLVLSFLCGSHVQGFSLFPYRRQIGVWSSSSYTRMAGDPVMEDVIPIVDDVDLAAQLDRDALMPLAPPLTFDKYLTMQVGRVV